MGHISVSHFCLGVSHLLHFKNALAALAANDLFCSHAGLATLPRTDDELHEFRMVDILIIHEREIRRPRLMWRIENAAIRVDLQHINIAICIHTVVTAGISIAAQFCKDAQGLFTKHFLDF